MNATTTSAVNPLIVAAFQEVLCHLMETVWVEHGNTFLEATIIDNGNSISVKHVDEANLVSFNVSGIEFSLVYNQAFSNIPEHSIESMDLGQATQEEVKVAAGLLMEYYAHAMGTRQTKNV